MLGSPLVVVTRLAASRSSFEMSQKGTWNGKEGREGGFSHQDEAFLGGDSEGGGSHGASSSATARWWSSTAHQKQKAKDLRR